MGQPKLLLPWDGWTVLDELLNAWTTSQVDQVVVVVRRDDSALQAACRRWPVHLVQPAHDPDDMKQSVQMGLQFLQEFWQPSPDDRCFMAPGDLPGLSSELIDQLLQAAAATTKIVVPEFGKKTGHPVLFPWPQLQQISSLPNDAGLNQLVEQSATFAVPLASDEYFGDIDTPAEYHAAQRDLLNSRPED